jgi:hypothetical protein
MKSLRTYLFATTLIAFTALASCGGGGDGDSTAPPPPGPPPSAGTAEGLWVGLTSSGRTAVGLVLNNGTYWVLYSLVNNSSQIAGVVQGSGTSENGVFNSSNGKDFNFEGAGVLNLTFEADYVKKQDLNARIDYSGDTVTLSATYDSEYELTPSLSIIAGTYSGYAVTSAGVEAVTVSVSATGAVSGTSASGCSFSGVATPRSKGNVYNNSVTFSGSPCANGTATVTGIGYWDATSATLYSAALNTERSNGFLFVAEKTGTDPSESIIAAFTAVIFESKVSSFENEESDIDSRLAAAGLYGSGNHVIEYKANLLSHVGQSFDDQVAQIIALSTQQGLRRDTVISLVTRLEEDWVVFMDNKTTTHLSFAGGNVIS